MSNLTYDYPYNQLIAKRFIDASASDSNISGWEPDTDRKIGGGRTRMLTNLQPSYYVDVTDNSFIQPGVGASYPMFDAVELSKVNEKSNYRSNVIPMQGGNIGSILRRNEHEIHQLLNYLDDNTKSALADIIKGSINDKMEGGFSLGDFGKGLLNFGSSLISPVLDIAAPVVGTALGSAVGNPLLGSVVAELGRGAIKNITGAGKKAKKNKKIKGIGVYTGETVTMETGKKPKKEKKVKSKLMELMTKPESLSGGKMRSDKMKKRNELVKKIMKEKNMKLGEASKYVKENKLI